MKLSAPKGTKDILPQEISKWQYIEETAKKLLDNAGYKEIRTPIFEATELFSRGVGSSTDIVNKEMYTFVQKDRSLTLRPENTAGVVRAYIENGMHKLPSPQKLWYKGPMFRYERPQAGRQRQFHQLGVELFGIKEPSADAEVILLALSYLEELKLKGLKLEINNIGCQKCREAHKTKIKNILESRLNNLCPDCHVRYEKNPLRILDCKDENCRKILAENDITAVINEDYVCESCSDYFSRLLNYLQKFNVSYEINKKLVRGLDYYNGAVFEITASSLGAQNAVCGGGRYDTLVEMLDGPPTPAVGWAIGLERLFSLVDFQPKADSGVYVISDKTDEALKLVFELRKNNIKADFDFTAKNFSKQFEKAQKSNAKFAVILGEQEIASNSYTLKELGTGTQQTLSKDRLLEILNGN